MFRQEKVFAMERSCIVGQKSYNINFFSFRIRNFVTPFIESVRIPARITPYPTGRLFWGGAVPGTSCLATISLSLRDKGQSPIEGPRIKLALTGFLPWAESCRPVRAIFSLTKSQVSLF